MSHDARFHYRFGASSAHRWFRCPGSVRLCQGLPERKTPWAEEGTRAHEILEGCLVGKPRPDGCSDEMWDSVQTAVTYIGEIARFWGGWIGAEKLFEIPSIIAPGQVGGTTDVFIVSLEARLLIVLDYKHGAGVSVEIEGNEQAMFYAAAVLANNPDLAGKIDTVCLVIAQPRIPHRDGPIREKWVSVAAIQDFAVEIERRVAACLDPAAPLIAGDKQCKFCPAATICSERERQAYQIVDTTFSGISDVKQTVLPASIDMTPERIAQILDARDLIDDWFAEVYKRALELGKEGVNIPGRKVVEALAKRRFVDGDVNLAEVQARFSLEPRERVDLIATALSAITGYAIDPDKFAPRSLLGIGETETILKDYAREHAGKGRKKEAVAEAMGQMAYLTIKESSGTLSLVPESDPRPAKNMAAVAFGGDAPIPMIEAPKAQ